MKPTGGSFRFDSRMLNNPQVRTAVSKAWGDTGAGRGSSVFDRIRDCRVALSRWKKDSDANSKIRLTKLQFLFDEEQSKVNPSFRVMKDLKCQLVQAYKDEDSFWKQKCRDKWNGFGDRNTKFFHASVKATRNRNGVDKLIDELGNIHRAEASKGQVAVDYFSKLFKTSNPSNLSDFFEGFNPRVTSQMNEELTKVVSREEVRRAAFAIKPGSAPGADGMSGLFFQRYWDVVGQRVTMEVQDFFRNGVFPMQWNFTQLCLIPKTIPAVTMKDLRPISLCSVMYKIVSKIIVTRLKPFLPELVAPNQSAFVADRLISDNIMIAHEAVHSLRTHNDISKRCIAIKTDMSKAYDRVEWEYVKVLLLAMGFDQRWVQQVLFCISTVTYTVLMNGQPYGLVEPERGLRQGDPLSPFLFVLCTEGLTHMMNKAENEGLIKGISFSPGGPSVHHLLFADDSLFMMEASIQQCNQMQDILKRYGELTGQVVNLDKSSITFGEKVEEGIKKEIHERLGITNTGGASSYLGLPECFSGSKVEMLSFIKDNMKKRFSSWFSRTLSQGGKEVLLKSVAMGMPVYAMSCFKLPKTTCDNIKSAMASYWWSSVEDKKKIHWLSWEKMCLPKRLGGMGFKDIHLFNQALLAKQAWKLLNDSECLLSRFLRSRYFDGKTFDEAVIGSRPSYGWRSIMFGKELLDKGLEQRIGSGSKVLVWASSWLNDGLRMRAPLT